jgi:peptidoglycan/LPS O-acetylase OafA/YrhL
LKTPNENGSHIPSLDGIRAIAFLLVYVSHIGLGGLVPGGFGVTVFFFLSGYLITTLLRQEALRHGNISLKAFYIRRAFRILPPMYITLALTYVLVFMRVLSGPIGVAGFLAALLYVNNYYVLFAIWLAREITLPRGMSVLWSLAIEEHFYLIFPFIYSWFLKRNITRAIQANLIFAGCIAALLWRTFLVFVIHVPIRGPLPWTYIATDCRFDAIAWGCLLAVRNNPRCNDPSKFFDKHAAKLAAGGLLLIVVSLLFRDPSYRESFRYTIQELSLYPIFYYCIRFSYKRQVAWLEWKVLRWVGWLSYSLYLSHEAILDGLERAFPSIGILGGFLGLALALLYAFIMRETIELPIRGLRSRVEKLLLHKPPTFKITST